LRGVPSNNSWRFNFPKSIQNFPKKGGKTLPTTSPFGAHFFISVGSFSLEEKQQGERDEEVQGEKQEKTIRKKN